MSETNKGGWLDNILFAALVVVVFGVSTYVCFNFFIRGRSVSTPNLVGRTLTNAKAVCSDLGVSLVVDPGTRNSDKIATGNVVWQNRTPGATNLVKRGTDIHVELSAGPLVLQVPDLTGQSSRTALLRLGQLNLKLDSVAHVESALLQGIIAEEPPKGTVVAAQTKVSLLVGEQASPLPYVMPDLIDKPLDTVRPALESHGLAVSNVKFESYPGIADGIIIRQFPLRGSSVSGRDPITVVVSRQAEGGIIEQPAAAAPTATQ
ncbi:MAG: PASTA domain-containing protein [Acidobacteria bacterium]|nr:PASTA domain-containing protein [Acidobacteriota bacterium]MBV9070452.1 PASTA domain-containing protein [Acidobacteriota bacterium]MBV9186178.1 PASTA domain-containing protein [Acidobacteriota bacterium]